MSSSRIAWAESGAVADVVESFGGVVSGLLQPYASEVMMVLVAHSSDRRHERKYHMIAATCGAGVFLFCAQFATGFGPYAAIFFLTLAVGSFLGRFGPFWTRCFPRLSPASASG